MGFIEKRFEKKKKSVGPPDPTQLLLHNILLIIYRYGKYTIRVYIKKKKRRALFENHCRHCMYISVPSTEGFALSQNDDNAFQRIQI